METQRLFHNHKPITAEQFQTFLEWVGHFEEENERLEAELAELKRKNGKSKSQGAKTAPIK